MPNLFSTVSSWIFPKRQFKLVMMGLDAAGKTTILYKLMADDKTEIFPTTGFNLESIEYRNVILNIWDLGAQGILHKLWPQYFEGSHAFMFVVDSSDIERIDQAKERLHSILEDDRIQGIKLLILCNKNDIKTHLDKSAIVREFELGKVTNVEWHIQSSSAKTGDGINEGIDWLYNALLK